MRRFNLNNCLLKFRKGDLVEKIVTRTADGDHLITLDGYAIVPLEDYAKYVKEAKAHVHPKSS
jgi:hypothetical protein